MTKYRTNVVLTFEIETDEDVTDNIVKYLDGVLPPHIEYQVSNIAKVKAPNKILGEFTPEDVFPFISSTVERKEYTVGGQSYFVRMDSHRYFVFQKNRKCVACGLEGSIFLLEMPTEPKPNTPRLQPHFNFYAKENGQLVLMTKDHIRSKAYGGSNAQNNYQTMCAICNCLKGSSRLSTEGVAELRRIYNENRRGGSKRGLATKIRKAKQQLVIPLRPGEREKHYLPKMRAAKVAEDKSLQPYLITSTDLLIGQGRGHLFAITAAQAAGVGSGGQIVGKIPAGVKVQTNGDHRQRKIGIIYEEKHILVYHGLLDYCKNLEKVSSQSEKS